jgi:thioredoxin-like negative regulator of GroEL
LNFKQDEHQRALTDESHQLSSMSSISSSSVLTQSARQPQNSEQRMPAATQLHLRVLHGDTLAQLHLMILVNSGGIFSHVDGNVCGT